MAVLVSMLRGVNVGGHNKIKMEALRALYTTLGLQDTRTYIQSGNVVFRTKERDSTKVAKQIQNGIARTFGFSPEVIVRTTPELRDIIAKNPFAKRRDIEAGKLLVLFLADNPGAEGRKLVLGMNTGPEELRIDGRELYIYFPDGMGRTTLPWATMAKTLKTSGTGRNWNSVRKLLEMAETLEASE